MSETLQGFEQLSLEFAPPVLIAGGIATVLVGLFVWLGGLGWRKIIVGLAGAAVGALCGCIFVEGRPPAVGLMAVLAGGFAVFFARFSLIVLGGVLAAAVVLFISVVPHLADGGVWEWPQSDGRQSDGRVFFSAADTISAMKQHGAYASEKMIASVSSANYLVWLGSAAAAMAVLFCGVFMQQIVAAAACSALGTILIVTGMIELLLYKGSRPLTTICNNAGFYELAIMVMVVFGTMVQLTLCSKNTGQGDKDSREKGERGKDGV